jgi:hypothetical protein
MYIDEDYLNEKWNVCYNPSCSELCMDSCYSFNIAAIDDVRLRGDNPSCICICYYR